MSMIRSGMISHRVWRLALAASTNPRKGALLGAAVHLRQGSAERSRGHRLNDVDVLLGPELALSLFALERLNIPI